VTAGKVLVVDDEENILNLLRTGLEEAGFSVVTAPNGFAALAQLEAEKPDLVIADVMMPRLTGLDLLRAIRNRPETEDIPFLFISARDSSDAVETGLAYGAVDYITKPFKLSELVGKVRHHIARRKAAR
jgi:DNA-binding response OmpR family regulator